MAYQIRELSLHTNDLVENLMQWSALQAGRIEFKPESIKLKELLNDIIQQLSVQLIQKNLKITFDMDQKAVAFADPAATKEILKTYCQMPLNFPILKAR